jgi:hypothetical protein
MIAHVVEEDCAKLLTIHPLKEGQKIDFKLGDGGKSNERF